MRQRHGRSPPTSRPNHAEINQSTAAALMSTGLLRLFAAAGRRSSAEDRVLRTFAPVKHESAITNYFRRPLRKRPEPAAASWPSARLSRVQLSDGGKTVGYSAGSSGGIQDAHADTVWSGDHLLTSGSRVDHSRVTLAWSFAPAIVRVSAPSSIPVRSTAGELMRPFVEPPMLEFVSKTSDLHRPSRRTMGAALCLSRMLLQRQPLDSMSASMIADGQCRIGLRSRSGCCCQFTYRRLWPAGSWFPGSTWRRGRVRSPRYAGVTVRLISSQVTFDDHAATSPMDTSCGFFGPPIRDSNSTAAAPLQVSISSRSPGKRSSLIFGAPGLGPAIEPASFKVPVDTIRPIHVPPCGCAGQSRIGADPHAQRRQWVRRARRASPSSTRLIARKTSAPSARQARHAESQARDLKLAGPDEQSGHAVRSRHGVGAANRQSLNAMHDLEPLCDPSIPGEVRPSFMPLRGTI